MTSDLPEEDQKAADDYDIDWDNRLLCSDGNCIGVIGADGCCKECGKKYEGKLPETVISEQSDQSDMEDEDRCRFARNSFKSMIWYLPMLYLVKKLLVFRH